MAVKTVGIREFRNNLSEYTQQYESPVEITRHGEPIGYYIPVGRTPSERDFATLLDAAKKLSDLIEQKGYSTDDMVAEFNKARKEGNK